MTEISEDSVLKAMQAFAKMKMEQEASKHSNTQEDTVAFKEETRQESSKAQEISEDSVLEAMQAFAKMKMEQMQEQKQKSEVSGQVNTTESVSRISEHQSTSQSGVPVKGFYTRERDFFKSRETEQSRKSIFDKIFNNPQPFERVTSEPNTVNIFNNTYRYRKYEQASDFGQCFEAGETDEETWERILDISDYIIHDIEKLFGGLSRVTDFYVISDILIINNISYEPTLSDEYIASLPIDIQYAVRNGQFAWLFNFQYLSKMSHLSNLAFDSFDFVFKKVRVDIGNDNSFEPRDLFKAIKSLNNLQIGDMVFMRSDVDQYNNVFNTARRSTQIADTIETYCKGWMKSSCVCIKDYYHNPEKRGWRKAGGLALLSGLVVATTSLNLTNKLVRTTGGFVKSVIQACKDID